MVTHGSSKTQKAIAGVMAASIAFSPLQTFGQDRRLAVNTTVPSTVAVPRTVSFGGLELGVQTLDRSFAATDSITAPYRTCRTCGERWRDRIDGSRQSETPNTSMQYYRNMVNVNDSRVPDGIKGLFMRDGNRGISAISLAYTNSNNGDTGREFRIDDFASAYRTATGQDLRRVRMLVEHGTTGRGEEYYFVIALPADERTGDLTGRQTISGATGYPGVGIAFYPNREEGAKVGSAMYIFVRES